MSATIRSRKLLAACCLSGAMLVTVALATAGVSGASAPRLQPHNAIPAAGAKYRALLIRPQHIPVSKKITKPIPRNKTIDFVVCGVPQCAILVKPLQQAAAALGWKVVPIQGGLTPETIGNAWNQVVHNHPSAAMGTGFPAALFSGPLATLKSEHIPVINGFVTDKPGNGVVAVVNGTPSYVKAGKSLADVVLGNDGTTADSLFIGGTTFPASDFEQTNFVNEQKALCPTCKEQNIDEPATITQTQLVAGIVAEINSHPGINYVVCSQPTDAAGLPQALKLAGHSNVKILVNTPDPVTLGYLAKGEIAGIMDVPNTDNMALMIDALARYETGQSVAPSEVAGGDWAVLKRTAHLVTYPYFLVPNYLSQYKKLWK
jgi:ribose transport system substrate-binding protein